MKKISFFLGILLLTAGSVWSQKPSHIPLLILGNDTIIEPTSMAHGSIPLAILDGVELTFDFSPATVSQIVIMDENNQNQVV